MPKLFSKWGVLVMAAVFLATCCIGAVILGIGHTGQAEAACNEWMRVNDPSCQVIRFSEVVVTKEEPQLVAKHPFSHQYSFFLQGNLGAETKPLPPQPKTEIVYTIYGRIGSRGFDLFGGWHETRVWRFRKDYTLWYTSDSVGHLWPND